MRTPKVVCFRVTRACNAACSFCLAPPDGVHPSKAELIRRLGQLAADGAEVIHFCGGEPTLHPALPDLMLFAARQGIKCKLTTNGLFLPQRVHDTIGRVNCVTKFSLHGPSHHHNRILRRLAYDSVVNNIRLLRDTGCTVSLQTVLIKGGSWVVEWLLEFCVREAIPKVSFIPFIPRGYGRDTRNLFEPKPSELFDLHRMVLNLRDQLAGQIDVRWLEFISRSYIVVETDGSIVIERQSESADENLSNIGHQTSLQLVDSNTHQKKYFISA